MSFQDLISIGSLPIEALQLCAISLSNSNAFDNLKFVIIILIGRVDYYIDVNFQIIMWQFYSLTFLLILSIFIIISRLIKLPAILKFILIRLSDFLVPILTLFI